MGPGDTVAVVAPSGAVRKEALDRGIAQLEGVGYKVKVGRSVLSRYGYLAGDDLSRAQDFTEAWTDPTVGAVIAARGGYGATRTLRYLDLGVLGEHVKILLGYSDITALHLAFWREMNLVTFHGPMVETGEEGGLFDPYNLTGFLGALDGTLGPGPLEMPVGRVLEVIEGGRAEGDLVGGNLSLIAATVGTRWQLDARGKILFLEDVDEAPYSVDRMLCQLQSSGILEGASGFLLGDFTDCEPKPTSPSFTVQEVLLQYFQGCGKPCLAGVPAGHGPSKATLPLGTRVSVDTKASSVTLLESGTLPKGHSSDTW